MASLRWKVFYKSLAKRAASANVIIQDADGRALVVKANYKPYWTFPGGWIDKGETPRQAAIRELKEEVGVAVSTSDLELFSVIERITKFADTHLFVFRLVQPAKTSSDVTLQATELDEHDWVTKQDVRTKRGERSYNFAVKNWASDVPLAYAEHNLKDADS